MVSNASLRFQILETKKLKAIITIKIPIFGTPITITLSVL